MMVLVVCCVVYDVVDNVYGVVSVGVGILNGAGVCDDVVYGRHGGDVFCDDGDDTCS